MKFFLAYQDILNDYKYFIIGIIIENDIKEFIENINKLNNNEISFYFKDKIERENYIRNYLNFRSNNFTIFNDQIKNFCLENNVEKILIYNENNKKLSLLNLNDLNNLKEEENEQSDINSREYFKENRENIKQINNEFTKTNENRTIKNGFIDERIKHYYELFEPTTAKTLINIDNILQSEFTKENISNFINKLNGENKFSNSKEFNENDRKTNDEFKNEKQYISINEKEDFYKFKGRNQEENISNQATTRSNQDIFRSRNQEQNQENRSNSNDNSDDNKEYENIDIHIDNLKQQTREINNENSSSIQSDTDFNQSINGIFNSAIKENENEFIDNGKRNFNDFRDDNVRLQEQSKREENQEDKNIREFNNALQQNENDRYAKNTNNFDEQAYEQYSTNEDIEGFKTFKDYQFLDRFEAKAYKGEYEYNFSIKERIENNLIALKLTQKIFSENRIIANEEEQKILSKYTGFGGLKDLFFNDKYKDINDELKKLLGEKYYEQVRNSSYTAYYTPNFVIKAIYLGLEKYGVDNNLKIKALEPSCGIGRFMSLAPKNYEFEAIEKDTITATICKFLHPNVRLYNKAFEEVDFENNEFDIIVGNPPFDNFTIKDYYSLGNNHSIHNYFMIKSSELLKENGLMSFVISNYFLDSFSNSHRKILSDNGILLNSFRLPNSVFKNSNTQVSTDLFFYSKKNEENRKKIDKELNNNNLFLNSTMEIEDGQEYKINIFYKIYKNNLLGNKKIGSDPFGNNVLILKNENIENDLIEKINKIKPYQAFKDNPPFERKIKKINYAQMDIKKYENIYNLYKGSIFYMNNKIYRKIDLDICEEVYFEDTLPLQLKDLIDQENIIEIKKTNFLYKNYLNEKEVSIAKKIIDFRDLLFYIFNLEKKIK